MNIFKRDKIYFHIEGVLGFCITNTDGVSRLFSFNLGQFASRLKNKSRLGMKEASNQFFTKGKKNFGLFMPFQLKIWITLIPSY